MIDLLLIILITGLGLAGWGANVLGLPGNWLTVTMAGALWSFAPESFHSFVSLPVAGSILAIAIIGELLEFTASALGTSRLGGSKRGTILAMIGSIVGAVVGLVVGTPIPIVGNVLASLLLGGAGACVGAALGERWAGKAWDECLNVGSAAFWGRILGTVGKVVCGTIALAVFLIAVWF